MSSAEKKPFSGSCKCGNIRYTVALKPPLTASRCNCTFCQKLSSTNLRPENAETDFKLLSPESRSEMGDFNPGMPTAHRYFCKTCGVHVFGEGSYEYEGQTHKFFSVNAATIDQPQDGIDLSEVQIQYFDGLRDNWNGGLKEKPWAGGMV